MRVDTATLAPDDPILMWYAKAVEVMLGRDADDPTSWHYQANIHGTEDTPAAAGWNQCRHGSEFFLPWHRGYVYFFERIVRDCIVSNGGPSDWALPYWNYDDDQAYAKLPEVFRKRMDAEGKPNPLYVARRGPGMNAGGTIPPESTDSTTALACTSFVNAPPDTGFGGVNTGGGPLPEGHFWGYYGSVESVPHNQVHVQVGGLMGNPNTAAQDPVFWVHHANIDRLWWYWDQTHANPTDPAFAGQDFTFFDADGSQVTITPNDMQQTAQLGYTYEYVPPVIPRLLERERIHMTWPPPWPEPPEESVDAPTPEPVVDSRLIGATDAPITLAGETTTATIDIDARAARAVLQDAAASTRQGRAFLAIEDVEAETDPGVTYGVYLNLPDDPSPETRLQHHVTSISLFGRPHRGRPTVDEHPGKLYFSAEITGLLDLLVAEGAWADGEHLEVTFRQLTVLPSADDESPRSIRRHEEEPIIVGRVSVHYA